jgi:hypothetical protein
LSSRLSPSKHPSVRLSKDESFWHKAEAPALFTESLHFRSQSIWLLFRDERMIELMSLRPPHVSFCKESMTSREVIDFHINEREIGGFNLTETLHPPGYTIPKHSHDQATLYILLQGSLTESYGTRVKECQSLEMIFTPAHEPHSNCYSIIVAQQSIQPDSR